MREPCNGVQVLYLESYQRLRQEGVFTHLQHFKYSPSAMSQADAWTLHLEIEALLDQDPGLVKAMADIAEPSLTAYRFAQVLPQHLLL